MSIFLGAKWVASMDPGDLFSGSAAWAAVTAAVIATGYAGRQATIAKNAVDQQKAIHHEQMQPYVYADLRGAHHSNQLLVLYVRNDGPTIAWNVRVAFDRPLTLTDRQGDPLAEWSISALPPGAHLSRIVGVGFRFLKANGDSPVKTTVTATGHRGPEKLEYYLDLPALKKTLAVDSDLSKMRHYMDKMATSLGKIEENTRPRSDG